MEEKFCWLVLVSAFFASCFCQADPTATGNVTCNADHAIITSAVYNDSDKVKNSSPTAMLNASDLMQVYEVCFQQATEESQCDAIRQDIVVEHDCVQGPVHDPCYSLEDNVGSLTLRRHWLTSQSTTDNPPPCVCRVASPVSQQFHLTAVNLHEENPDRASRIDVISLLSEPSVYIPIKMAPFPRDDTITSENFTVKFVNDLQEAVQILTITAANSSVNISCESNDEFTATAQPFDHDVTSVDIFGGGTTGESNSTQQFVVPAFTFPLKGFTVGIVVALVLLLLLVIIIAECRQKHREQPYIPIWNRFSVIRTPGTRASIRMYSADDVILREDLDTIPEDCLSVRYNSYRPASAAPVPPTPPAELPLNPPQFVPKASLHPLGATGREPQAETETETKASLPDTAKPSKELSVAVVRSCQTQTSLTEGEAKLSNLLPSASKPSACSCAEGSCAEAQGRPASTMPTTNVSTPTTPAHSKSAFPATLPRMSAAMNDELDVEVTPRLDSAVVSRPHGVPPPKPKRKLLRQMSDDVTTRRLQRRLQEERRGGGGGSENSSSWLYEDAKTVIPE